MAKRKHTHQYHRTYPRSSPIYKGEGQWSCALPDCSHFIPRNMDDPIGKGSLCNNCMSVFMLDEENMKFDKPVCASCANQAEMGVTESIDELALERHMIRSTIAVRTGRDISEVSDEEVDRQVRFNKLRDI